MNAGIVFGFVEGPTSQLAEKRSCFAWARLYGLRKDVLVATESLLEGMKPNSSCVVCGTTKVVP